MSDQAGLTLQVQPGAGDDRIDLLRLTEQLRTALLDLDIDDVRMLSDGSAPEQAKAAGLIESLAVKIGVVALKSVMDKAREWAGRSGRSVKVVIDGDSIELAGVSAAQQKQLLDLWLARHAATDS